MTDKEYALAKAQEWEKRGDAAKPGSAYRAECFEQARKWERTAEGLS